MCGDLLVSRSCRLKTSRFEIRWSRPPPGAVRHRLSHGLALPKLHLESRVPNALLQVFKVHARSQRDLALHEVIKGLTNHRDFRRVNQVEDRKDRALSVLNEAVKSLRLNPL